MPKISIIVPVYKVEKYLNCCVDSILNQTFTDFECILVDDGSPDNCGKICDEYAKKDKRIKVIHKSNGGLSDARNAGLDIAKGDYIGFVDSDDWIHPKMYEVYYELANKNMADIVVSPMSDPVEFDASCDTYSSIISNAKIIDSKEIFRYYFSKYYKSFWVSVCSKLYKSNIFENIRFEKGRTYEDVLVCIPTLLASKRVCMIDECFYYYNDDSESITRGSFNISKFDILYVTKKRCQFFEDNKREYDIGMTVWYYCYTEFAILTELYARNYRKAFKPYRQEMKKSILDLLRNTSLCRLYKLTTLLTFVSPRLSERICGKYFQNVTHTVNSFRKHL